MHEAAILDPLIAIIYNKGPVSSFGRVQVVGSRGPRIWPRPGRRRVPHVQLKSEMLCLRGAEVERRVSRIYTNKNVCA